MLIRKCCLWSPSGSPKNLLQRPLWDRICGGLTFLSIFFIVLAGRVAAVRVATVQVGVAVSVTLVAGLFQLAMRVCQLGVVCTFMSMAFIVAFLTASATQIIVSQVRVTRLCLRALPTTWRRCTGVGMFQELKRRRHRRQIANHNVNARS